MKKNLLSLIIILTFSILSSVAQTLPFSKASTYYTGIYDDGGTEITSYDSFSSRLFSTNGSLNQIDIIDISDLNNPTLITSVDLSLYVSGVNSVATYSGKNVVAIAGEANLPQLPGKVLFIDTNGTYISQLQVGALPDMVTFTPDGLKILVANEGEPTSDYTTDPIGSVSIINIGTNDPANLTQNDITDIDFTSLDNGNYDPLINIYGNDGLQMPSQDLEPEYITVDGSSTKAYVVCQENNALAIIDLTSSSLDTVVGLGYKDHSVMGNGLDASNTRGTINIDTYDYLFGMYQPDAITAFEVSGQTYIATANEGDARDYNAYSEEERVKDVTLNLTNFPAAAVLQNDNVLGRLKITSSLGDNDNNGTYDSLFCFGARSFSIWDENGQLVWDSGDEFENIIAQAYPNEFNSTNDDNSSFQNRSDDKGPEPEAVAVGEVDGTLYAFIGLERMGGIMIYDLTNPASPSFVQYELNRDFSVSASDSAAGDLGPEGIVFVPATESPSGRALIIVSSEVSGTISFYELGASIVGIEENAVNMLNSFYPNPSTGIFNTDNTGIYKVYDMNGRFIMETDVTRSIDLSQQAKGFYMVKDEEGNAIRLIKK